MKTNNKCAAVRLEKSRLLAALAVLAVAFVALAAIPAAADDSDATGTDTQKVGTYGDLVNALKKGGNIELTADITISAAETSKNNPLSISVSGTVLDLGGHKITMNASELTGVEGNVDQRQAIIINTKNVVIKNGTVDASVLKDDGSNDYNEIDAIFVMKDGSATLIDLNVLVDSAAGSCVFNSGSVKIESGTYTNKTTTKYPYGEKFTGMAVNQSNSVTTIQISITGGTFKCGLNPADGDDHLGGTFVADGYAVKSTSEGFVVSKAVASIGDKKYTSLADAVEAATEGNESSLTQVNVIDDVNESITLDKKYIKIVVAKGKTLSGSITLSLGSQVIISEEAFINATVSYTDAKKVISSAVFSGVKASAYSTIAAGSVEINGSLVAADENGTITVTGDAMVSGNLEEGITLVVKSGATMTLDSELGVDTGATIVIKDNATLKAGNYLTVNGTLEINGSIETEETTGKINGTGAVTVGPSANITKAQFDDSLNVTVDPSAMSTLVVGGDSLSSGVTKTEYPINQIITISTEMGYWTLNTGADITINGKLVVPEGTTLTVQEGAVLNFGSSAVVEIEGTLVIESKNQAAVDGKIVQKGGVVTISGTADIAGEYQLKAGDLVIEQDSAVVVTEDGKIDLNATDASNPANLVVKDSAVLTVNGGITHNDHYNIYNYGRIVIDSAFAFASFTISQAADGAVVEVVNIVLVNNTALTITDDDLVTYEKGNEVVKVIGDNEINVKGHGSDNVNASVSGITVTEKVTSKSTTDSTEYGYVGQVKKAYSNVIQISGNIEVASVSKIGADGTPMTTTPAGATATITVSAGHEASVPADSSLVIGGNVTLINHTGSTLVIEGSVDSTVVGTSTNPAQSTIANKGTIKMSGNGTIVSKTSILSVTIGDEAYNGKFNGAAYETGTGSSKLYNYSTLDAALAFVNADGNTVKTVTAYGEQAVTATAKVPAGVTLALASQGGADADVTIGEKAGDDVTLTIAKTATLNGSGTIDVNGTLYAEDKTNVKSSVTIISDVYSEQTAEDGKAVKNGWAKWTNLVKALSDAVDGETITISKDTGNVEIEGSIEIKSGVTLVVPEGKAPLYLKDGVTLTISGTLTTGEDVFAETKFDLSAKNLADDKSSAIVVNGTLNADKGVSYGLSAATASAAPKAKLSEGAPIAGAYYGTDDHNDVISTLKIALTAAKTDIIVNGAVTVGDITFTATDNAAKIIIGNGLSSALNTVFNASSIVLANGAQLAFANVVAPAGVFNGTVTVGDASVQFVGASNGSSDAAVFAYESEGALIITGNVAVSDKDDKLAFANGTVYVDGLQTVSTKGTVSIAAGAVLEPAKDKARSTIDALTVEGVLSVPAGTGIAVTTLTVVGTVTVGPSTTTTTAGNLAVTTMYLGMKASDAYKSAGAAASVSGTFAPTGVVYVAEGTVLDEAASAVLDGMAASATFHVDGAVWFSAYSSSADTNVKVNKAPVQNAEFLGWATKEGGDVKYGATDAAWEAIPVKTGGADYYAVVNTLIYRIIINADEGIANIYLNGQAMNYGMISTGGADASYYYGYTATVAAGSYTVTYTLQNGWSGEAKLYLNGTAVANNTITVSGNAGTFNYQLSGIEKSGYVDPTPVTPSDDGKDGLTITDYLLIVLVVLIVIMAVIVAMRLMRS